MGRTAERLGAAAICLGLAIAPVETGSLPYSSLSPSSSGYETKIVLPQKDEIPEDGTQSKKSRNKKSKRK